MSVHEIHDLTDPRLAPYLGIRHKNWTHASGWFIAEGPLLVERLLVSEYQAHSVLLDRKYFDHYRHLARENTPLIVVDHDQIETIAGFNFHRGILACGLRQSELTVLNDFPSGIATNETILVTVGVQDPENLGGMLRTAQHWAYDM